MLAGGQELWDNSEPDSLMESVSPGNVQNWTASGILS